MLHKLPQDPRWWRPSSWPQMGVCVSLMLIILCIVDAAAQSPSTSTWYFGNRAGIAFRQGSVDVLADGQMSTLEGCATVSDPTTGELLFYTDGVTVWNRLHEVMPNGTGLFGDRTTAQSAIIVPAPGRPSLYYVFNPAAISSSNLGDRCLCLYYSIIDMRNDAGFGDVIKKNELVLNDITEHVTATADCKGDGWWIIARSRGTRHFFSLHLTRQGLATTPVISDAGYPSTSIRGEGQMHVSPDGQHLVYTSMTGRSLLYDVDGETGKITYRTLLFPIDAFGKHYGAAFSPNSEKVYVSVANISELARTQIVQFDITARDPEVVMKSQYILTDLSDVYTHVPMQLAPDGKIYIGRPGQPWLATIERPNDDSARAMFRDSVIRLTGTCQFGLPNIPGTLLIDQATRQTACSLPRAAFALTDSVCAGSCIVLRDQSTGTIASWQWGVINGTPSSSTQQNPTVCFSKPGTHAVRLIVANGYGADTAYSTITVLPQPSLVLDSVGEQCAFEPVRLRASGAATYEWSPASALDDHTRPDPIARVNSTTRFVVIGTTAEGCKDTATVLVRVSDMDADGDATICRGTTVPLRVRGAERVSWTPTTGLSDPTSLTPLARPLVTTAYVATMGNDDCVERDTVVITVVDDFDVAIIGSTRGCPGDTVALTASVGASHQWRGNGIVSVDGNTARVVIGMQQERIAVIATSGDCVDEDSVVIAPLDVPTLTTPRSVSICRGESAVITIQTSADRIRWTPSIELDQDTSAIVTVSPTESRTYIVQASLTGGCSMSDTIQVTVVDPPTIEAGPDLFVCAGQSIILQASGSAERVEWTPTDGLSDALVIAPRASPSVTTTYIMRGLTGTCETLDTMTVVVSSFNVDASSDTTICLGDAVELVATGAGRYQWSPSTGLDDPQRARPIARPTTTTTYTVTGYDARNCEERATVTVTVRDTTPIILSAGSVTARAGTEDLGIPIFVEVPSWRLPLKIDELRATMVHDAAIFIPDSTDRGAVRTSVRGSERLSYLVVRDQLIIAPRQKITEVRGLVLASSVETVPISWEDVTWTGESCPTVRTTQGLLYVTGCNIVNRMLRNFDAPTVRAQQRASSEMLDIELKGTMPGSYALRLVQTDGRVVWSHTHQSVYGSHTTPATFGIDMSVLQSGSYILHVVMPTSVETIPVMWIK